MAVGRTLGQTSDKDRTTNNWEKITEKTEKETGERKTLGEGKSDKDQGRESNKGRGERIRERKGNSCV